VGCALSADPAAPWRAIASINRSAPAGTGWPGRRPASAAGNLAFAFAIAGATRSPEAASGVSALTALPLSFLIGTTYPRQALPGDVPQITGYLPFSPLIQAVRGIALGEAPITHYGQQLLIGLGWLLAALILAVRLYRLTEE